MAARRKSTTYWQGKMRRKGSDSMAALCERIQEQNDKDERKRQLLKGVITADENTKNI